MKMLNAVEKMSKLVNFNVVCSVSKLIGTEEYMTTRIFIASVKNKFYHFLQHNLGEYYCILFQ